MRALLQNDKEQAAVGQLLKFKDTTGSTIIRMSLKIRTTTTFILAVLMVSFCFIPKTQANVYATNIKLNGGINNVTGSPTNGLNISYILNEPATLGVTVKILSGANPVRSISITGTNAGTLMGTNTIVWDGKSDSGVFVGSGTYKISITAAAAGFTNWTQTSSDNTNTGGYYVFSPRGIAVNTNPKSIYYGRVFAGNAANNSAAKPGDVNGIIKFNADGSLADEGQSSGGYTWIDDSFNDSPHYLRYGQDDRIYALDFTGPGVIVAFDMAVTTNQVVLNQNNYSGNPFFNEIINGTGWGMMDVTDAGTPNGRLWLGDHDAPGGAGVWAWHMTNGVADPADNVGTQAIAVGGALSELPSGDFMMDASSNIFVSQQIADPGDPTQRTMEFTNWNGVTPMTNNTAWQVGANDDGLLGIYDTALDTRLKPTYVALPMDEAPGGIRVLYASNGVAVTNATGQSLTNLDSPNVYFGAAWDAVGNLYGVSSSLELWRVFSPPGTNQATTVAVPTFQSVGVPIPTFTSIVVSNTTVTLQFTDSANLSPSAYTLQSSANPGGPYSLSAVAISQLGTGVYRATTTTGGSTEFYRIKR